MVPGPPALHTTFFHFHYITFCIPPAADGTCITTYTYTDTDTDAATLREPVDDDTSGCTMDAVEKELDRLTGRANLAGSIRDIDGCLELLVAAKAAIESDPTMTAATMAALETQLKAGFDRTNDSLKEVYTGLNKYGKALDKKFKLVNMSDYDVLSTHQPLINRAIAMHLLREGNFSIAETFIAEADLAAAVPPTLEADFRDMYRIKEALRLRDLGPAIAWAASRREQLEARGSNLEFELHRLQYVVYLFGGGEDGPRKALEYSRREFLPFQQKYLAEISQLAGALLWREKMTASPYADLLNSETAWAAVADSFTSEFCSLLNLAAESPLYIAATAGAIALPTLLKMTSIMKEKKTEWTSQNELPVEIPLPDKYKFHSIFVCPVSKEQTTDSNPPMMIPCGHVLAKDSLQKLSRSGNRFKCPYCPADSMPKDAREIYL
ncbi:E3 ubiquitin-protein ligase [Drechslerella dactyloides]|uniref:GID complex catalytic subunit 2 n=1 Tax=Drechslerella dactyloides TaxID=74499 RepID=A0AAD6NN72_DREDA|nr:E3 ubiquitin-protein ligase [Drechslerella dactyloides]